MALKLGKNVVPIKTDEFVYPEPEQLPEDIRAVSTINSVPWSHQYQDASIKKLLSFLQRGD